jgi:hypothetical protein
MVGIAEGGFQFDLHYWLWQLYGWPSLHRCQRLLERLAAPSS